MQRQTSSSARVFAPLALAIFLVALFIVVSGSLGGGTDGDVIDTGAPANSTKDKSKDDEPLGSETTTAPVTPKKDSYTVREGDTLDGIAVKMGVPVERIEELNPSLDPRALTPGTTLELTE